MTYLTRLAGTTVATASLVVATLIAQIGLVTW